MVIILCLYLAGCSGSKSVTKKTTQSDVNYDESFDPMTLNDNDIEFPSIIKSIKTNKDSTIANNNTQDTNKEVNGFRVQIIATQNLEKATLLEEEAKSQFAMSGHKTYLIFEAPLYKIRLGDFTTRNQADELKIQALKYGYREAFIVRTKVTVSPKENY